MQERPAICCFDLDETIVKKLRESFVDVFNGSLGKQVQCIPVYRHTYNLLPQATISENLHEYNIIVLNLCSNKVVPYDEYEHKREKIKIKDENWFFTLDYPKTIFDPRPFIITSVANDLKREKVLLVIFCGKKETVEYNLTDTNSTLSFSYYSFFPYEKLISNKKGTKEIAIANSKISAILKKYIRDMTYNVVFDFEDSDSPWNEFPLQKMTPLLFNKENEVISFYDEEFNFRTFAFPDINDKENFLLDFFSHIAPLYVPEMFPDLKTSKWIEDESYYLPNHANLLEQKKIIEEELLKKIREKNNEISNNRLQQKFLHELITETGDDLLLAAKKYLEYLEFCNVKIVDKKKGESGILEEDIKIENQGEPTLLIEVKGISNTSTDNDCSKIGRIVKRRMKEKGCFDICGLYLVNHQRNLPPINRKNPPFEPHQIEDAKNDERGLLTTWQLFNLYFDIEEGIISKGQVRKNLFDYGIINFTYDNLEEVGVVKEAFPKKAVIILDLKSKIDKDTKIFYEMGLRYIGYDILSIQVNGESVSQAENCEVGIMLNAKIKVGTKIYKQKHLLKTSPTTYK